MSAVRRKFQRRNRGAQQAKNGGYTRPRDAFQIIEVFAVASAASARRNIARWREQCGLARERLAQYSNAAIVVRSRQKMVATP